MRHRIVIVGAIAAIVVFAATLQASDGVTGEYPDPDSQMTALPGTGSAPPDRDTYGTSSYIELNLGGGAFANLSDSVWSTSTSTGKWWRSGGSNSGKCANVVLPSGALVSGVTVYLYDNSATAYMQTVFTYQDWLSESGTVLFDYSTGVADVPGWVYLYQALPGGNYTVPNDRVGHIVCVFQWSETGTNLGFNGVTFWYHLQISPAPGSATFGDVPISHPFFQHIEALYDSGITAGCGGGNFCPNNPLTRGQMAVFLANALGLHFGDY